MPLQIKLPSPKIIDLEKFQIIAKTLFGLEEVLVEELKLIGATDIEPLNRAVSYYGDEEVLYKSNLHLRTALTILKPILEFKAKNETELYLKAKEFKWEELFNVDQTLSIDGFASGDLFTHSKYIALKVKDAIADRFREQFEIRPNVDVLNPDIKFNVHIATDKVTISIDTTGEQLGKRGYRQENVFAPLAEPLAAGIILLSGWDKESEFFDGMCGSGTFAIEAALIATNTPPGLNRNFAFEKLNTFNDELWQKILTEAKENIVPTSATIRASDIYKKAVHIARSNAERANMDKWIEFDIADFLHARPKTSKATVILNPPYGERIQMRDLLGMYQEIGNNLKKNFAGCEAWIISSNIEALKLIGLKPSRKIALFNGKLECKLHKFELFRGTHKERVMRRRI